MRVSTASGSLRVTITKGFEVGIFWTSGGVFSFA
jgi:hypothetical protein